MNDNFEPALTPEKINQLLSAAARDAMARILCEQDAATRPTDEELDERIAQLDELEPQLKRQARNSDYSKAEPMLRAAAQGIGITLPTAIPVALGRQGMQLLRSLCSLESEVLDGEDVRTAALPIVHQFGGTDVDSFVVAPVLLEDAIARTYQRNPSHHMKGNIDTIAKLLRLRFGNIPVAILTKAEQDAFFRWLARLPRNHGKAHGKNRFTEKDGRSGPLDPEKYAFTKDDEIAWADAADEAIMEEIRARNDISVLEKRAILAERLTPRLTLTTLKRYRDSFSRVMKGADDLGCKNRPPVLSYKDIETIVKADENKDDLYIRVTKPKLRMAWTEERLAEFLTCPIYTGSSSPHRRWRPGNVIVRDAIYWVPLIVLAIGSRIEEILELKRTDIVYRNKVYCLAIGLGPEQRTKTEASERVIPIPQMLLDLGFIDWWKSLGEDHGLLLFPDAAERSSKGTAADPFSKAFYRILDHLDLRSFDEDIYALRKTLSSMLHSAGVAENERQAIAGHRRSNVINRCYTAHRTKDLKAAVDRAAFQLEIVMDARHGFPVIRSSGLAGTEPLLAEVILADDGQAQSILLTRAGQDDHVFAFHRCDPISGDRLPTEDVFAAAKAFREICDQSAVRLPIHHLKRLAFEHFQALG
ncbi:phage integrase family protein [Limimaricola soesokkakensis]|uniref:Phage integrase family protein n=1 Tax=Limimaricola soesokkakensis TaxID=1343159 RepID=A0A1X6YTH5_9RHOB|nr:site-specific integrase [Limimaricola soesokkakensis]PSK87552.1 phage integrase family protein [Limimaricola soesokkakensis]SLN31033.1 Phage integrase family protein [Limimaricola soesokkakensis]